MKTFCLLLTQKLHQQGNCKSLAGDSLVVGKHSLLIHHVADLVLFKLLEGMCPQWAMDQIPAKQRQARKSANSNSMRCVAKISPVIEK
jgi:hypothetical protein